MFKNLVSARRKLPRFQGRAYRAISPTAGMEDVWRPGAVLADAAFTSAAANNTLSRDERIAQYAIVQQVHQAHQGAQDRGRL